MPEIDLEGKSIFQLLREAKGQTREKASELLGSISNSRLIRFEAGETSPYLNVDSL